MTTNSSAAAQSWLLHQYTMVHVITHNDQQIILWHALAMQQQTIYFWVSFSKVLRICHAALQLRCQQ
jgi:hypothetical protein